MRPECQSPAPTQKVDMATHIDKNSPGRQRQVDPGSMLNTSLNERVSFRFSEGPCLKGIEEDICYPI